MKFDAASFRGVPFQVQAQQTTFGRRQVVHEYPQRDRPFSEDLGRKARTFTIEAYVVGADYRAQRDRLIAACEQAGPGELIHPTLGHRDVVCTGLSLSESTDALRLARCALSFTESGRAQFPSSRIDPGPATRIAADGLGAAAGDAFARSWTVAGLPAFAVTAATERVRELTAFFRELTVAPLGEAAAVAEFGRELHRFAAAASALVAAPAQLATRVRALLRPIGAVYGARAPDVLARLRVAFAAPYQGATHTPVRQHQAANHRAYGAVVRECALGEAAIEAVGGDYATHEDAVCARDRLIVMIDAESERPGIADEVFTALEALRPVVVEGLPPPMQRLPSMVTLTPPATLPSLVLAWRWHADAHRADELVARNRLRDPGFVPGRIAVQVGGTS